MRDDAADGYEGCLTGMGARGTPVWLAIAGATWAACSGGTGPIVAPLHECTGRPDSLDDRSDFEALAGCRCAAEPQATGSAGDVTIGTGFCDPFPCTAQGCYVKECKTRADCASGNCSVHTSPVGWCVAADYE
jgi:hypothetical protein